MNRVNIGYTEMFTRPFSLYFSSEYTTFNNYLRLKPNGGTLTFSGPFLSWLWSVSFGLAMLKLKRDGEAEES